MGVSEMHNVEAGRRGSFRCSSRSAAQSPRFAVRGVSVGLALAALVSSCDSKPVGSHDDDPVAVEGGRVANPEVNAWRPRGPALPAGVGGARNTPGNAFWGSTLGPAATGTGGTGPEGPSLLAFSLFCGDGVRDVSDPIQEECDDGLGDEADLCTNRCQVADTAVVPLSETVPAPPALAHRYLGEGRHPVAGSAHGFGVTFVDASAEPPAIGLSIFDPAGDPRASISPSAGASPVLFASPVVAALPNGDYAVAWTDFDVDGDELGVALRRVTPAPIPGGGIDPPVVGAALGATLSPLSFANGLTNFSQYDADLIVVGDALVAAWTDETDPLTAPDIRYRTFSASGAPGSAFSPTSGDRILSQSEDLEGNVALAPFGTSFAAAWRSVKSSGLETIEVFALSGQHRWSVSTAPGGHLPAAAEDRPALAELDETHLLLLFTVGTDPGGTSVANVGRLRAAVLDTQNTSEIAVFALEPLDPAYSDPSISQSQPSLARTATRWYAAWRTSSLSGDANGEDAWLARIQPNLGGGAPELLVDVEVRVPRWPSGSFGDQRAPSLAAVPPLLGTEGLPGPAPDGALALAWTDYGQTLGPSQGKPDVLTAFLPEPIVRFPQHVDCTVTDPCDHGEGDCDSNDECLPGLVCPVNSGNGPNFGLSPDMDACVPPHCANGVQDLDETNVDCGGADCGQCLCGDGIFMPIVGEECDEAGNTPDCDSDCTLPECGDGLHNPEAGEICDGAGNTPTCDSDCTLPECGDGIINTAAGEVCDPSVVSGCRPDCQGYTSCSDPTLCPLFIEHKGGTQPTGDNFIDAQLRIRNNTGQPVPISQLRIRYWFTRHDDALACSSPLSFNTPCYVPGGGTPGTCSNVSFSVAHSSPAYHFVDTYVDATFSGGEVIAPGAFRELNFQIIRTLPGNQVEHNDYSYQSNTSHSPNPKIALYRNNQLVWGVEPSEVRFCGDGLTTGCETCDSSGMNSPTCDADCTAVVCGDGLVNAAAGETCEPQQLPESATCDRDCTARVCGDGHVNPVGGEVCEPSLIVDCSNDCHQSVCGPTPIPFGVCRSDCTGFNSGCTNGSLCLKTQYRPGPGDASGDAQIRPHFKIVNNGFAPVPLSQLKIRYYFTIDGASTLQHFCDYAGLPGGAGCSQITRNVVTMSPTRPGADRYLELAFSGGGTLAPCESTGEIQIRLNKSSFANFNESNDYSYQSTSSFVDRAQIVVLRNNQVIWGTPP